jgi:hypothetical protein
VTAVTAIVVTATAVTAPRVLACPAGPALAGHVPLAAVPAGPVVLASVPTAARGLAARAPVVRVLAR